MQNIEKLRKKQKKEKQKKDPAMKRKMAKIIRNIFLVVLLICAVIGTIFGVREWKKIDNLAKRTTFSSDEAGRIGNDSISMAEFMLYSIDVKNGYETQYGDKIWSEVTKDANGNEDSFENVAKEDTFEQIRFTKALIKEAEKQKIELSDTEEKAMESSAEEYYQTLTGAGVSGDVVTVDDIKKFYKENYLAQKVYYKLTGVTDSSQVTIKTDDTENSATESADSTESQFTTEDMQKLWKKLINKYYPDFDYELDINWETINQISFASEEMESTETKENTESVENTETVYFMGDTLK